MGHFIIKNACFNKIYSQTFQIFLNKPLIDCYPIRKDAWHCMLVPVMPIDSVVCIILWQLFSCAVLSLHTIELAVQTGLAIYQLFVRVFTLPSKQIIIWDECTMAHKRALESRKRTMKDLHNDSRCFRDAMILLSSDFRYQLFQDRPLLKK